MAYTGGFIDHYIIPIVYPTGLTDTIQFTLGLIVLVVNASVYLLFFLNKRKHRQKPAEEAK